MPPVVEAIGSLASLLVIVSLAMRSVVKLRIASTAGGIAYSAYGVLIGSWPVVITNVVVVGLNLWALRHEFGPQRNLGAVPMEPGAPFLSDFLRTHLHDIQASQPDYTGPTRASIGFVLMRDGMPAGAILGDLRGPTFDVRLDYVLPEFRDSRLGQWFYRTSSAPLRALGVTNVVAHPRTASHLDYLRSVGFTPNGDGMHRKVSR